MDLATAQEISTICHSMAWMDYFLDKERMLLDCILELQAGEQSRYAVAEARGLSSLGFGFMTYDFLRLARRYHQRAGAIAQQTGNPSAMAFATFSLGFLDFYDASWDAADAHLAGGAAIYREAGDLHRWGGAMLMRGMVLSFRGDLPQLAAMGAELIRAGLDAADPQLTSWGYQVRGYHDLAVGPLDEAVAQLREGAALAARIQAWDNYLYQQSLLGKCLVIQGRLDESMAALREAVRVMHAEHLGRPFDQVEVLTGMATCSLAIAERAQGPARQQALREARRDCDKALRAARTQQGWLPQALRLQGNWCWLSERHASAESLWRESLALAERFGFAIERGQTLLEIGQRTGNLPRLEQAEEAFRRSGAGTHLGLALRARAALASPGLQPA
jgi:tetratricopeptide (TPR) repeat protein